MISNVGSGVPLDLSGVRYLVVGCGFFGAVIAERIARDKKSRVVVIDKRTHVGGNSYSEKDGPTGIEYHLYGSHIFHTRSERAWAYINRFCRFNNYRHRVLALSRGRAYTIPINLSTINAIYGLNLDPQAAKALLCSEISKESLSEPANLEEKAISLVGRRLYEALIRDYTVKQWGMNPRDLPPGIISRLPVRFDYNPDYFDDLHQGIPLDGYGKVFEAILAHENIDVYLGVDYFDVRHMVPRQCLVVYTGPVDRYFDYRHGRLNWRTLRMEKEIVPVGDYQGTAVMNYSDASVPFTRIHEFRHYHRERNYRDDVSLIIREYPANLRDGDDPHYPVNCDQDGAILGRYREEEEKAGNLILGGRLGMYRYINMDEAIDAALDTYDTRIRDRGNVGSRGATDV